VTLTPAERRGALALLAIFVLGAVRDLWETRPGRGVPLAPASAAITPADTVWGASASAGGTPAESATRAIEAPPAARRVDLNRASAAELDELPGVGPVLAGRIVEYRRVHGPFRAVEELLAVRGVGPKSFGRLRPRVQVGETTPADAPR
jgi:competence protein ComEA